MENDPFRAQHACFVLTHYRPTPNIIYVQSQSSVTMRLRATAFLLLLCSAHGIPGNGIARGKASASVTEEEVLAEQLAVAKDQLAAAQAQLDAAEAEVIAEGGEIDEDGNVVLVNIVQDENGDTVSSSTTTVAAGGGLRGFVSNIADTIGDVFDGDEEVPAENAEGHSTSPEQQKKALTNSTVTKTTSTGNAKGRSTAPEQSKKPSTGSASPKPVSSTLVSVEAGPGITATVEPDEEASDELDAVVEDEGEVLTHQMSDLDEYLAHLDADLAAEDYDAVAADEEEIEEQEAAITDTEADIEKAEVGEVTKDYGSDENDQGSGGGGSSSNSDEDGRGNSSYEKRDGRESSSDNFDTNEPAKVRGEVDAAIGAEAKLIDDQEGLVDAKLNDVDAKEDILNEDLAAEDYDAAEEMEDSIEEEEVDIAGIEAFMDSEEADEAELEEEEAELVADDGTWTILGIMAHMVVKGRDRVTRSLEPVLSADAFVC